MSSFAPSGRQFAIKLAAAITFAFTTGYGFFELMGEVPRFPLFLVLPVFFVCWALAALLARGKAAPVPA